MDKELIRFYPKVVGDPIKFQRVWRAVHQVPDPNYPTDTIKVATVVWQDGAWWCMVVEKLSYKTSEKIRSTWGTAQKVTEALSDYGTITGINHIDFTHLK